MALVVGIFESIFFRGFLQGRLVAMFGSGVGIATAAGLYGLYHVGYGMGLDEMIFLLGLGVVYAIAYQLTNNLLVLWPLLTPLGSFYAQVDARDIDLPWASILGFLDVAAVMMTVIVIAHPVTGGDLAGRSAFDNDRSNHQTSLGHPPTSDSTRPHVVDGVRHVLRHPSGMS